MPDRAWTYFAGAAGKKAVSFLHNCSYPKRFGKDVTIWRIPDKALYNPPLSGILSIEPFHVLYISAAAGNEGIENVYFGPRMVESGPRQPSRQEGGKLVNILIFRRRAKKRGRAACWLACLGLFCSWAGISQAAIYYVNDGFTNGDVYCTAVGLDSNTGTTAADPKRTVTNLLASFPLGTGDTVYVDTGLYSNYTISITSGGTLASPMIIQGSTNYTAGGTVFERNSSGADAFLISANYVELRYLTVAKARDGVRFSGITTGCRLLFITSQNNNQYGFQHSHGGSAYYGNCVAYSNTTALRSFQTLIQWDRGVLWGNSGGFQVESGAATNSTMSNSIVVAGTAFPSAAPSGDFNILWNTRIHSVYSSLESLQNGVNSWWRSSVRDPLFVDPEAGVFYPRSVAGRYNPATDSFVTDTVHSAAIDTGEPLADYGNELPPNGSRLNIGSRGNSRWASKSNTNAWLLTLSFTDNSTLYQTGRLVWTSGNIPTNETVRLQYSPDRKTTWLTIVTNLPITNAFYLWDASSVTSTPVAFWRVIREADTNVVDISPTNFAIRGLTPVRYYVNDTGTVNDVYTTVAGAPGNDGLTPITPKDSIQGILDNYVLGGDHVIYVDTGVYTGQTTTVQYSGGFGRFLVIQGSTNDATGGTVLDRRNAAADVLVLSGIRSIRLRDLVVTGGRYGLSAGASTDGEYENVVARGNVNGFRGTTGNNQLFRRCVAMNNTVGVQGFGTSNLWDYGVSWSNGTAFSQSTPAQWSISNSVIVGGTAFSGSVAPGGGDYNLFWNTIILTNYANLALMQKALGGWTRSAYADPLFVDPAGGNFHERSTMGTYSNGSWVIYTNHSSAIDFGSPTAPYTNEPAPNGSNVNIGIYGNTSQAGKSRTNAWLMALNYNDGGTLNATTADAVYWNGGNLAPGATVRVELSLDGGATWGVAASNLLASAGSYAWANTNFTSSRFARWRVVFEANTNVFGATTFTNFSFQNGSYLYYLNDDSPAGDVYCSAAGNDANTGTSSGSPKYSLKSLVDAHEIQAGDIIYVDSGNYSYLADQVITVLDSGASNLPITVRGSTNYAAGGTVFNRRNGALGLHLNGAPYYDIRDITVTNAVVGIRVQSAPGTRLNRFNAKGNTTGFEVQSSADVILDRCRGVENRGDGLSVSGGGSDVLFSRGIHWRNRGAGIRVASGRASISNSVIVATGNSAFGYYAAATNSILGNYNVVLIESNALAGFVTTLARSQDSLDAWVADTSQERHSFGADPLFANPSGGDFHLQTDQRDSRWIDGLGWNPGWDSATSPLIDSGDPAAAFTNEALYNGSRINIGMYGNTTEASKRAESNRLFAASLRQGGVMRGVGMLHWVVNGPATSHFVQIDYSPDGGQTWVVLTNRIAASAELFTWNTAAVADTPAAVWRITSTNTPTLTDRTTNFFSIRNAALTLYVNDTDPAGDVYTTGPGAATNWQATSSKPLDSLERALAAYELEPGDRIFVDTGSYTNSSEITIQRRHSGSSVLPVAIIGSTNEAAGGSLMVRTGDGASVNALHINSAQNVVISNLLVRGGRTGIRVTSAGDVRFSRVQVSASVSNGIDVVFSTNVTLSRTVSYGNGGYGVHLFGADAQFLQSVAWSNTAGAIKATIGTLNVTNSLLEASGSGAYVYTLVTNPVVRADYNDILARDGAYPALDGFFTYKNVNRWVERRTNDARSLTHEPLFVDSAGGDFHVRSSGGRYDRAAGVFVADTTNSPLIDTGHPGWLFAEESGTNGSRINIGLYGNDSKASRSRTEGWLLALSLNDGGSIRGTNILYFVAGGAATNHNVTVDFSWDAGISWTNVATNIVATAGQFTFATHIVRATSQGVLRYRSQTDTSIVGRTENLFTINNEPLTFYVNDAITNGDVYCAVAGQSYFDGSAPEYPADSILTILRRYDPQPGDRILVDTGTYGMSNTITMTEASVGEPTNQVVFAGSTNQAAGGTVLDFGGRAAGISIRNTANIIVRNLRIRNAQSGVKQLSSTNCLMDAVWVQGGGHAFEAEACVGAEFSRCVAFGSVTSGLYNVRSSNTVWRNGVLWSNRTAVLLAAQSSVNQPPGNWVFVSNSVIACFGSGTVAYAIQSGDILADYNAYWLTNNALMAQRSLTPFTLLYDNVSRWRAATTQDVNSLTGNPGFNDPDAWDFHEKSRGGRFNPATGTFVTTDTVTSILIDAGPKTAVFTNETPPHGSRANIGLYGQHPEASRTPTNAMLNVITLNDGGLASGSAFPLRWLARGNATGHIVRLEYSWDSGTNWALIATNIPARNEEYVWNTLGYTSSLFGVWRLTSTNEPALFARNALLFMLRNTNFVFYVNDTGTAHDVYTIVPGADNQSGLFPDAPKASVQGILDAYDLEGGDLIYVDTGVYTGSVALVTVGQLDGGQQDDPQKVTIQGSTNGVTGGTVLDTRSAFFGVQIQSAASVALKDLTVLNAISGQVRIVQSAFCLAEGIAAYGGTNGFLIDRSQYNEFRRCAAVASATGLRNLSSTNTVWQQGVLWSNQNGIVLGSAPGTSLRNSLAVSNTIFGLFGSHAYAYNGDFTPLKADYNNLYLRQGVQVALLPGDTFSETIDTVSRWTRRTGQDAHSLTHHPGFVQDGADFHLRSQAGHFSWAVTNFITTDTTNSVLIDAGGPLDAFGNEPAPNGERVNLGIHANTWQASKTSTNAHLTAVSLNDAGRAQGTTQLLYWVASGDATGHTVQISFSGDGGGTWAILTSGVSAALGEYIWDTTAFPSTLLGLWEVRSEVDTNVFGRTENFFAVRNTPVLFYVNDSRTNGDVYATAPGVSTNNGLFPHLPKDSLQNLLDSWDVEPGDIVYVDTGSYTASTGIVIGQLDAGDYSNRVYTVIQGSTNEAGGGTVLYADASAAVIALNQAEAVNLRHLILRGGSTGVQLSQSRRSLLEWLRIEGGSAGVQISLSDEAEIRHCLIRDMTSAGVINASQDVLFESGVLWSNRFGVNLTDGKFLVRDSIISSFGTNAVAYRLARLSVIESDYNAFLLQDGALAAYVPVLPYPDQYFNVARWARASTNDVHSFGGDPLMADPVNGLFHLQSQGGRYVPSTDSWIADPVTSPLIDSSSLDAGWTNEPSPNGRRRNIGLHGNSGEASRTPTNAAFTVITFNDGGRGEGTIPLYWIAHGNATGHTVRLDYSSDGGSAWQMIATNIAAGAGVFYWDSLSYPSAIRGSWRS